eukprot:CAMPEP_0206040442 /NCGR_PEP_ID=MMETSP1466-20131121/5382_1 /ASSEMBLY_ACC=CAM_ASM_001126 /TAXON_ID=44452 /ORGANISM="Pavlova gyrans, Strain CCMP608" /LENGTH=135 /DNA_ID=CAMNT_0053415119 /DNA_START=380 /DNA_END=787 /DNA_ORIENTATION=+
MCADAAHAHPGNSADADARGTSTQNAAGQPMQGYSSRRGGPCGARGEAPIPHIAKRRGAAWSVARREYPGQICLISTASLFTASIPPAAAAAWITRESTAQVSQVRWRREWCTMRSNSDATMNMLIDELLTAAQA